VPARQSDSSFTYEVSRTEEEWRSLLTETEYAVMREGFTEKPRSSLHWDSEEAGMYWCKGCELPVFDSRWKTVLPKKGWVFFAHAEPASVLTKVMLYP
jgi:peptide-methionine (R)-S-oxide reductase